MDDGSTLEYDALIVANGHHWDPRWPEPAFPGEFDGLADALARLRRPDATFVGKNVVVLGMGNSAMDIAVETSTVADNVYLAARSGVHVVPKYAFGRPFDHFEPPVTLPWPIKQKIFESVVRLSVGKVEDYGLPKPEQGIGEAHPTVSSDIFAKVGHGFVKVKPNIKAAGRRPRRVRRRHQRRRRRRDLLHRLQGDVPVLRRELPHRRPTTISRSTVA